jgi:hypothetical protein
MAGSEASAANHRRGDSFGAQTRCEPSPNILRNFSGNAKLRAGFFCFFMA